MHIPGITRLTAAVLALCLVCTSSGCTMNSALGSVKPEENSVELTPSGSGKLDDVRYVSSKRYPTVRDSAFKFSSRIVPGSIEDFALILQTDTTAVYYYYASLDDNTGYYAIDSYDQTTGEHQNLMERENITYGDKVNFCSVMMSASDNNVSIACVDNVFYCITCPSGKTPVCAEAAMPDKLKKYIGKYVGSTDFICLDMAKMSDHVAAVFMNNDENSDDYQKTAVVTLEFDFGKDKAEKRITDWEEYYVNEADNLTFDPALFGNYITSSIDADTGDVIFLRNSGQRVDETKDGYGFYSTKQENLSYIEFGYISTRGLQDYDEDHVGGTFSARNFRISKGNKKVAKNDTSLSGGEKTNAINRKLVTFTLLCNKNELDQNSGMPVQYLMLIFNDAIEMWKLEESENFVGNVKLTPKFEFYVPFEDGESLKMADGLNQVVYDFERNTLYTAGMKSGVRVYKIEGRLGTLSDTITEYAAFVINKNYYIGFPDNEVFTSRKKYVGSETQPRETIESMEPYDMSDLAYAGRYWHGRGLNIYN